MLPPALLLQVYYAEAVTETVEEFEAFDVFSLVGELGGALGLFLGWSCLNLLLELAQVAVNACCRRRRRRKSGTKIERDGKIMRSLT